MQTILSKRTRPFPSAIDGPLTLAAGERRELKFEALVVGTPKEIADVERLLGAISEQLHDRPMKNHPQCAAAACSDSASSKPQSTMATNQPGGITVEVETLARLARGPLKSRAGAFDGINPHIRDEMVRHGWAVADLGWICLTPLGVEAAEKLGLLRS